MPNSWFQFKQFKINQDKTAMKVGTDSALLGSWTDCDYAENILDIGTGTGILALMMAQRSQAIINAIDIEPSAVEQAQENINDSPWANRICVFLSSLHDFYSNHNQKYSLIICNPPYHSETIQSGIESRDLARRGINLPLQELFFCASKLLTDGASISIILPFSQYEIAKIISEKHGLFPFRIAFIKPNNSKAFHRVMLQFSFYRKEPKIEEIRIELENRHQYSPEFKQLLEPFYLTFKE